MLLTVRRVIKNWEHANVVQPCTRLEQFTPNQYGRRYARSSDAAGWCDAFAAFGLIPSCVEPRFQNMTTNHYLDGAFTHDHKDVAPEGFVHVRCNVMLKKPPVGGNPIIDGEHIKVEENDLWLCLASLERHSSEPIQGGERIMFSFGGLVPMGQVRKILA